MGLESIRGVAAGQSYQSAPVNKPAVDPATTVTETAVQSDALNQAVAATQVMASEEGNKEGSEGGKPKKEAATMKDVAELNKIINRKTIAEFGYNEPTNRITIKIKDKETNEVIKEIPSDKALEMLAKAWELAGILVDEKR